MFFVPVGARGVFSLKNETFSRGSAIFPQASQKNDDDDPDPDKEVDAWEEYQAVMDDPMHAY